MCDLTSQVDGAQLATPYMYDNAFSQHSAQHAMSQMPAHYESFMAMPGHHSTGQRYGSSYPQSSLMPTQEKPWDENENTGAINEEFISLKSNDFSISVYHRYNGANNTSTRNAEMCPEASLTVSEPYPGSQYPGGYNCPSQAYSPFHAPLSSTRANGPSQVSSRSLYMPPTPPSSEPGSPSQQMQQSRAGAVASHQLKQSSGPIHTSGSVYLSVGDPLTRAATRKPSPPPSFGCLNGKQALAHFTETQVPPITGNTQLHLSGGCSGTIPVPFRQQQQQCGRSEEAGKVSHSPALFASRTASGQSQYNAAVVAQITATVQPRYNRRNNPELEKRRIHRCDFPG